MLFCKFVALKVDTLYSVFCITVYTQLFSNKINYNDCKYVDHSTSKTPFKFTIPVSVIALRFDRLWP